ncbi:MAG: RnfABCDGE type electron transport complex subunit B [Treponema sp.]|nr:RnfABCDGE type electron transport complex subunit B [Treponema sp.]MBQ2553214.1 RnfABCDGE type electron transport complex subunit B [Treponema sp.]MBQ5382914.1 RnfABCDGE type electron transport complex subunit B [Treponema sp.]
MMVILFTAAVSLGVAFVLGLLLGLFKKIFTVKVDPKVQAVQDILSGGNCGGCGYAGCAAFAAAVVKGDAPPNGCVAGGPSVAEKVGQILGVSVSAQRKVTVLACKGTSSCASSKGIYNGIKTCAAASMSVNGTKSCSFGCVGFGDCVEVCSFGGIFMGNDGIPVVNYDVCVGCGKCVKACPKHLFKIIDGNLKGSVALCSNRSDNKPSIKKNCSVGCIKCGICEKKCPEKCIVVTDGIPVVDYSKCTSCGACISACPDKVLDLVQNIVNAS